MLCLSTTKMMNVRAVASAATLVRSFSTSSPLAAKGFGEREQALENSYIQKMEKEALRKLRESLAAKASHEELNRAVAEVEAAVGSRKADSDDEAHVLEVRKEVLERVRKLEDEVAELKYRLKRLE